MGCAQNLSVFRLISWLPFVVTTSTSLRQPCEAWSEERSMLVVEAAELAVCDVEQ
jgi:hypothetical protein